MTVETLSHKTAISDCEELAALITRHTNGKGSGTHATAIAPLEFMRQSDTSTALINASKDGTKAMHQLS